MLEVSPLRAFSDNYLWLIRAPDDPSAAVVVDPGDARPVEDALARGGLALRAILVTHHHPDHVGGVQALAAQSGARVFEPARERLPCTAQPVDDGDTVSLADLGLEFRVMAVPGHTLGHVAYHGHGALFCGDTLFSGGCGRLFEGTAAQMLTSLDRLAVLPGDTVVCCAHEYTLSNLRFASAVEPENSDLAAYVEHCTELRQRGEATVPSSIAQELKINPFLRSRSPSVRRAVQQAGAVAAEADDVAFFAALRGWKDRF